MLSLGALAFLNPWLLAALGALPVLWLLLRAIPPAPKRTPFPGVRLLLGLIDPERQPERTPWWLLLLRILALAALILGFAQPILNPRAPIDGTGPVMIVLDGGWASAPDWAARQSRVEELLEQASRAGRPVALFSMADPVPPEPIMPLRAAEDWQGSIAGMVPQPWAPDRAGFAAWLEESISGTLDIWWLSDGLDHGDIDFADALSSHGAVTMILPEDLPVGLRPARLEDGLVKADLIRAESSLAHTSQVAAIGIDPGGTERRLALASAEFAEGEDIATASFDLPIELRNRITRLSLTNARSAGAVTLTDEGVRRRKIGLLAGGQDQEATRLVAPLHYLRKALVASAEVVEAELSDILLASPDVIILADVGTFAPTERDALETWVREGGLLIRFAGPRVATAGRSLGDDDSLMPVRLRAGGRTVGGTMSWGAPRKLKPFNPDSMFYGLAVKDEITVSRQVMAEPDANLPDRILASLEDGTPLITGRDEGEGRVVLFHVTASAEWSSLPISGLFVQMLERLALQSGAGSTDLSAMQGTVWTAESVLDGFGRLADPTSTAGVPGERIVEGRTGIDLPPGVYVSGERRLAVNLIGPETELSVLPSPPSLVAQETLGTTTERPLIHWFLLAAFVALTVDLILALWLSGRLTAKRIARPAATLIGAVMVASSMLAAPASAQNEDAAAIAATRDTVLAYVVTGDSTLDNVSAAGLSGLSRVLSQRTAIEPGAPVAVNIETDDLAFYPMLYWPISESQATPSPEAYAKLNAFIRSGGMIVFDTRDAQLGVGFGSGTPNGRVLQRIAARLDIPALEPVPADHVLTRTFYLLQNFPGRWLEGDVWVEAATEVEEVEGMPFRNLNDGVTPVIIGSNDWASAWALDATGRPMFPVGRSLGGERQREMAWRFGINLVMHVMTGNYKSDQVHVPALLERLGN